VKYRFSQGDKECESITISVNDQQNLWGDGESYPSLNVPWIPGGGKLVIEMLHVEDKKEKRMGEDTWSMTGNIIHKSNEELSEWWPLETTEPKCKFLYTVRRKGFGPIPRLPVRPN